MRMSRSGKAFVPISTGAMQGFDHLAPGEPQTMLEE
jgi:hypothetical protein